MWTARGQKRNFATPFQISCERPYPAPVPWLQTFTQLVMKLLSVDLSTDTPVLVASPNLADLHRLWDANEKFHLNMGK